jgi:hypothetical protein
MSRLLVSSLFILGKLLMAQVIREPDDVCRGL